MDRDGKRPIIIRRIKKGGGGHHGGAWKVAYADFVTAMMAFFLLMWLLSTTSEEQRRGLADYFSPALPLFAEGRGGDGPFGGSSMFSDDTFARDEPGRRRTGKAGGDAPEPAAEAAGAPMTDQEFWAIERAIGADSGDAVDADPMLRHIRTRLTDEGLIIEVFDLAQSPLFAHGTAEPSVVLERLLAMIGRVLAAATNPVAVAGHLARAPEDAVADPWRLSSERAQVARGLLVEGGVAEARIARVIGKADRRPATDVPADPRNRRLEITLLRRFDG